MTILGEMLNKTKSACYNIKFGIYNIILSAFYSPNKRPTKSIQSKGNEALEHPLRPKSPKPKLQSESDR